MVAGDEIISHPKLVSKERVFACLLVCSVPLRDSIDERRKSFQVSSRMTTARKRVFDQYDALYHLLYEYIPIVFILGYMVRQCNWDGMSPGSGHLAFLITQYSLTTLIHLLVGNEGHSEYIKTLCMALMTWSDWHTQACGAMFSEEICEALLSRLVSNKKMRPNITSLEGVNDIFLITKPGRLAPYNITKSRIPKDLPDLFKTNLNILINRLSHGAIPFCRWSSKLKSTVLATWDPAHVMPGSPFIRLDVDQYADILLKTCITVATKRKVSDALKKALDDVVPRKSAPQVAKDQEVLSALLHASVMPERYRKKRANSHVREVIDVDVARQADDDDDEDNDGADFDGIDVDDDDDGNDDDGGNDDDDGNDDDEGEYEFQHQ
jgi:hypothetical protein